MKLMESFIHDGVKAFRVGRGYGFKPKMTVHFYWIDGLLIDSGPSCMRKSVLELTRNLLIKKLFLTHHHEDHSGNVQAISDNKACRVYASKSCAQLMKNPPKLSLIQKLTWGSRPAFSNVQVMEDELHTEHYRFQIIPIPGHACDMVALYEADKKWLFSADLFINTYIDYFIENESMKAQIKAIKTVLNLDFDVLFCAHKPQLNNPKKALRKKLQFFEQFYEQVEHYYHLGYDAQAIFKRMKLKENRLVKLMSGGYLSKINMVTAVIRDVQRDQNSAEK